MTAQSDGYLSASKIAKQLGVKTSYVTTLLQRARWIAKDGKDWCLTEDGEKVGGKYMESKRYGTWIAWPEELVEEIKRHMEKLQAEEDTRKSEGDELLTATKIGKRFKIPATRMNAILSELGWVSKGLKGWNVTAPGKAVGGVQREDHRSGVPYVIWPSVILENQSLRATVEQQTGVSAPAEPEQDEEAGSDDFRKKYDAAYRATDGHYVRSKAEMLIDNWLYMAEIVHAYERKLPVEEDVYSDFYIPAGKIYIEFWGMDNDARYQERKKTKQELYAKYGFNLIELNDQDVQNLDDVLPRQLLKFGVQAY